MSAVKLPLEVRAPHEGIGPKGYWYWNNRIRSCLPYFKSTRARSVHRVRRGSLHRDKHSPDELKIGHATFELWCGQVGFISDDPYKRGNELRQLPGGELCPKCEMLAVKAGLPSTAELRDQVVRPLGPRP